jgi:hypothetical protein
MVPANAGRSVSAVINDIRLRGIATDNLEFTLRASKDPLEGGHITRFTLDFGNRHLKVPLQSLRALPYPDLSRIEVTHRIPGFMGWIAQSIDPSTDTRESIIVTIPYGATAACINPSDSSDVEVVRSEFTMTYALNGELIEAGSWSACQQCAVFGSRCEVEDEAPDNGGKGSN